MKSKRITTLWYCLIGIKAYYHGTIFFIGHNIFYNWHYFHRNRRCINTCWYYCVQSKMMPIDYGLNLYCAVWNRSKTIRWVLKRWIEWFLNGLKRRSTSWVRRQFALFSIEYNTTNMRLNPNIVDKRSPDFFHVIRFAYILM